MKKLFGSAKGVTLLILLFMGGFVYTEAQEKGTGWVFTPLPLAFYTSDTGIAGGALLVAERGNEPSNSDPLFIQTAATYTQKHQAELSALFQGDFSDKTYRLQGEFGFFNTPSLFYGLGPEAEVEEDYEELKTNFELLGLRKVWKQLYGGMLYKFDYVDYTAYEKDGAIAQYIPGAGNTVRTSNLGMVLQWDSRSSMVFPRSGSYLELRSYWANEGWGSDSDFYLVRADMRGYYSLFPQTILAAQALGTYGHGDIPLHKMAELGGLRVLRGYPYSRYRDKSSYVLQSELRFPIYGILRGTVFASAGQVGSSPEDFHFSVTRIAGGAGLRIRPNPGSDVQIRLDVGFSPDSFGIYITLLEAF